MCIKVIHNKCGDSYRTCIKYKDSKGIEHSYSKTFKKRKDAEKHEKLMKAKIASEKEIKKECFSFPVKETDIILFENGIYKKDNKEKSKRIKMIKAKMEALRKKE